MSKTPYEIRTELLHMSKEFLEAQFMANREFAKALFEKALENGQASVNEWERYCPTFYSFEDVVKYAENLYSFVSKKEPK